MKIKLLVLFVLAGLCAAQTPPPAEPPLPEGTIMGVGAGYQASNNVDPSRTSGWFTMGHRTGDIDGHPVYTMIAHDTDGATTSTRLDLEALVFRYKKVALLGKLGAGAATGLNALGNTNTGFSWSAGGTFAYDISALAKRPNVWVVASFTRLDSNVNEPVEVGTKNVFQRFGQQGVFRFGLVFELKK